MNIGSEEFALIYCYRWKKVAQTKDRLAGLHQLKEDHEYTVRVTAVNKIGKSQPKEADKPFVAQDKPSKNNI